MNSISKIERFVALTNVLSFLVSNRNIVMEYSRFKRVYEEYESLSIPPLIKEIEEAAPDFNALQGYFDFAKCKLNDINLPNMALLDVSELYKDDGNLRDEAIEAWDYVIEKCGELRLSILDFADRYHLRDNYPKENFLQPLFYNWIETDEKLNEGTNGKVGIVENETVQPIKEQNTSNDLMPKASSRQMLKEEVNLPEELNTPEARRLLQKAIKAGLCDKNYKWHDTKALLAYLADSLSKELELGVKLYGNRIETSWQPFATLFGTSARELIDAKKGYENNKNQKPKGYKKVDQLFL